MGTVSGQGTTFNLLNYTGEIINVTPQDTPFLTAISGISAENFEGTVAGAVPESAVLFQWQTIDLRDASANNSKKEGQDAPTPTARSRSNVTNVLEIHHEALSLSYTKMAATQQFASTGSTHPGAVGLNGAAVDERTLQMRAHWAQIARDVEKSFISGVFQNPADNNTERKTRGILSAISTNVIDANGYDLADSNPGANEDLVLDLLQMVWDNGGISESGTAAVMVNGYQRRRLTKRFITDGNYREASRTVGGVRVDTIVTDFGELNVILNRHMPPDQLAVVSLEQCRPHVLAIPDKGIGFFAEPLAKTGASDRWQLYGEIGLEYGNEKAHGKITNLPTSAAVAS